MKVISVIEDGEVSKKILKHLGLWEVKACSQPKTAVPQKIHEYSIDYSVSQLPASDKWMSTTNIPVRIGYKRLLMHIR